MKICMVGAGYVGLVTGACFAETGQRVVCADIDASKIELLNNGTMPIFEAGLKPLVDRNVQADRLSFTTDVASAIRGADVVFVGVGTPSGHDGAAHLGAVDAVATMVAENIEKEMTLVLKSTVPVGTNARVTRLVAEARHPVHVVSNPEFLREGEAVHDFLNPDRVILGIPDGDAFARKAMDELYHAVVRPSQIVWMDPVSAELTKYVANSMLAMRISFMNEMAVLCDAVGGSIHSVREGVGSDKRIGPEFLRAGPGYGGSCFPKDVKALVQIGRSEGIELELAATTDRVNDRQKGIAARKVRKQLGDVRGQKVAVWGVTFKPKTDDCRESPSLTLIASLVGDGAEVVCHDPEAKREELECFGEQARWASTAYEAAKDADILCLMTDWREYQSPDFERLRGLMRQARIVDMRNLWTSHSLAEKGFSYDGIGT